MKAYRSDLNSFAKWYAHTSGSYPEVAGVGPLDVAEYKRYLVTREKKPATVNRALASLRTFFSWAAGEGLVDSNPAGDVKSVKSVAQAPKALNRREQLALMRAVQRKGNMRDIAIIT